MSSFLCFICHSTVNMDTNEITREKYKELVGMHLNQDSHLCHICCHVLNKFWLFRSVCLKRSMEYPVLFSEKGTIYLNINDIENFNLCPNNNCQNNRRKSYHNPTYYFNDHTNDKDKHNNDLNDYINDTQYNNFDLDIDNEYKEIIYETEKQYNKDINYFDSELINNVEDVKLSKYVNEKNDLNDTEHCSTEVNDNYHLHNEVMNDNERTNDNNKESNNDLIDSVNVKDNNDSISSCNGSVVSNADNNPTDVINGEANVKSQKVKKKVKKKSKKSDFEKIVLSLEEQKAELEKNRKEKKYIEAEFKCYNCALGFLFKDTYQTHMLRHEESNGEYRCTTCTLRFVTPAVFRAHTALHTDRYKCIRCGLVMRPRQCKAHALLCSGRGSDEIVSCHLCGNTFKDSSDLSQHLRRFHKLRTKNRTYSCTVCGKTYNNQAAVRTHMIKHIQRQFPCEQCSSIFSSPYMLNQHMKKHESTHEQHFCATCKIVYSTRKSLLAHRRKALAHQRMTFECRVCSRMCPNRLALSTHMQRVHSTCKQYACNVCGRQYATSCSLRRHEATHMPPKEGKLHMCHICPRTFKSRSKLNRHLREVCEKDKLEEVLASYYNQETI